MSNQYLTERELCKKLRVNSRGVESLHLFTEDFPQPFAVGDQLLYDAEEIDLWVASLPSKSGLTQTFFQQGRRCYDAAERRGEF
jgi:hypothetical protein